MIRTLYYQVNFQCDPFNINCLKSLAYRYLLHSQILISKFHTDLYFNDKSTDKELSNDTRKINIYPGEEHTRLRMY